MRWELFSFIPSLTEFVPELSVPQIFGRTSRSNSLVLVCLLNLSTAPVSVKVMVFVLLAAVLVWDLLSYSFLGIFPFTRFQVYWKFVCVHLLKGVFFLYVFFSKIHLLFLYLKTFFSHTVFSNNIVYLYLCVFFPWQILWTVYKLYGSF